MKIADLEIQTRMGCTAVSRFDLPRNEGPVELIRFNGANDYRSLCEMDMCDVGISRLDVYQQPKVAKLGAFSEMARGRTAPRIG